MQFRMFKVEYKENRGNCAIALDPIRAGYCILETHPEMSVPLCVKYMIPRVTDGDNKKNEYKNINVCFYCFEKFNKGVYCSYCKYVVYCSDSCLERGWKIHRDECEILRSNIFDKYCPSATMRLVINSYLNHFNFFEYCGEVSELPSAEYDKFKYQAYITAVALMGRKKKIFHNMHTNDNIMKGVIERFIKVSKNTLKMMDKELEPVGLAVYRKPVNFFNHSCVSNCVTIFKNRKIIIRAIYDIYPGEELTISYVDVGFDRKTRLAICADQYFFTCSCRLCKENIPSECHNIFNNEFLCSNTEKCRKVINNMESVVIAELEHKNNGNNINKDDFKVYPILKRNQDNVWKCMLCKGIVLDNTIKNVVDKERETAKETALLESLFNEKYNYDSKTMLQSLNKIKSKIEHLSNYYHHARYSLQKMRSKILYIAIQLQEFKIAYNIASQYVKSIEVSYGKLSPIYGYYVFLTGKLALFLDMKTEGLNLIHKAKKIIVKTHGVISPIYKDLEKFLYTQKF